MTIKSTREYLVIPLVVGLLVAAFSYLLPKFFGESRELSYTIEDPFVYFDKSSLGNAVVTVNDLAVSDVVATRVRVWNTGTIPLKDLAVRIEFSESRSPPKILSVNHNTKPNREFGSIHERGSDQTSKRFVYQLLNPGDEDSLVFLSTSKLQFKVFAKAEGLSLQQVKPSKAEPMAWWRFALVAGISSLFSDLLRAIYYAIRKRKSKPPTRSEPS